MFRNKPETCFVFEIALLEVQVVLDDGHCTWPCPHTPKGVCLWWLQKCSHKVRCDWSVTKHVKVRLCL